MPEALKVLDVPAMSPGAPMPQIAADDLHLVFGYVLGEADCWTGGPTVHSRHHDDAEACAIVSAPLFRSVTFGAPNDEALRGHRLAAIGLQVYAAYEVENSEWIEELERANRVHPRHRKESYARERHFIFVFHDTTLEFVAASFDVETAAGPVGLRVAEALARLQTT